MRPGGRLVGADWHGPRAVVVGSRRPCSPVGGVWLRGERRMRINGGRMVAVARAGGRSDPRARRVPTEPGSGSGRPSGVRRRPADRAQAPLRRGPGGRPPRRPHRRRLAPGLARHRRVAASASRSPTGWSRRDGATAMLPRRPAAGLTTVEAIEPRRRGPGPRPASTWPQPTTTTTTTTSTGASGFEHVLLGASRRPRDGGPLRRPRREVPDAVPERLLHHRDSDPDRTTNALRSRAMTANVNGVRIEPTEWNRNDGFSPGR